MALENPASPTIDLALRWTGVSYAVDGTEILKDLSGTLRPRRALAIMGSSGAGKTTLLNAISDRLANDKAHIVQGSVSLNGVPYERQHRRFVGFVPQDDVLSTHSTPAEVLAFSLRVRRGADQATTARSVDAVINELDLEGCRDTIVGTAGLEVGLSGGERKQTNIGVELICDPKILLLDEPTSGLDSVTATTVISLLRDLARRGRSVAYTVHQPTNDSFELFDDIMLMIAGEVAFHGPANEAVEYFTGIGYECPSHYTPSDYFMQLLQDDDIGPRLAELWKDKERSTAMNNDASSGHKTEADERTATAQYLKDFSAAHEASYMVQFAELSKRALVSQARNRQYRATILGRSVVIGIFFALIFVNLQDTVTGVADRHGLMFMLMVNFGWQSVLSTISLFPPDRAVFVREQQTGSYAPVLYGIAKLLTDLPLAVVSSLITAIIVYFPTRLALDAGAFFVYCAVLLATHQIGSGLGLCISVAFESYQAAVAVAPLTVMPMMMTAGLLASTDRLRPAWIWLEKISFLRWGFVLLERNEFEHLDSISCDASEFTAAFCARQPTNGTTVLDTMEFRDGHHEKWLMWVCFAAGIVLTRVGVLVLLTVVARRKV